MPTSSAFGKISDRRSDSDKLRAPNFSKCKRNWGHYYIS